LFEQKKAFDTVLVETVSAEPGEYAVAVKDLSTGRRWALNPYPMRAASLIKIYIMVEAFRQHSLGSLALAEELAVTGDTRVGGAGPLEHAPIGTVKSCLELVELMITESDNTATNMLINRLTLPGVNETIQRLGCYDTVLQRKMLDFASAAQGRENFTSVTDVATVLEKLYHHRCLGKAADEAMLAIMLRQSDRCKLPLLLPPDIRIAHKTGELDGAEHDAGIVYSRKADYIVAIMSDHLPDEARGREVIAGISRTIYDFLA
jgi:beta-lactamase class A